MSFPAYSSYRDSGVEWLGAVPSHWSVVQTKREFRRRKVVNAGMVCEDRLALTMNGVVPRDLDDLDGLQSSDYEGYQIFEAGDLAFKLIDLQNIKTSRVGMVPSRGIMSPAYIRLEPANPEIASFGFWYFMALYWTQVFNNLGGGVRQTLGPDDLLTVPFPLPPRDEQVAIAVFLDRETAKLDALIEEQRRLIALLKEKRQAVISHAVTKGLDPDASMKDSGIEWLSEVPEHWTVAPLKRAADVLAGYAFSASAFSLDNDNWRLLRGINLSASGIRWNDDTVYWERSDDDGLGAWELRAGDIVLGMDRPWISDGLRIAEVTESDLPCMLVQRVAAVRANSPATQRFILHCLRHEAFFHHCAPDMTGVSVPHISGGQIEEFRMPLPPVDEMDAIAAYIDSRSTKFEALIGTAESAIKLLSDRRSALIAAAVTGKIDVRQTGKLLPFPVDRARARSLVATEIIERSAHQPTFGRVKFQKIAFLVEGHVGVHELAGRYTREAAGPLDRALIAEMESGARSIAGVEVDQAGGTGTAVSYRLCQQRGAHRQELADWLGVDRITKLDKLIADFADLSTKGAEAVATLYGVWNDALIEGASPTDDEIISGFLHGWHPEKREKFRADELPTWLDWMRRHGIEPTGTGPKTSTGRLFA